MGQMKGGSTHRCWCLQMLLAQSHGVNIKSANNLQQYVAATFGSQVNERLVVLDLATTAIVEQRARGLNGYKKVDALRAELADRQLDTTGKKADLVARLDAAAAEVPLGWKDLEQILQDLQDKKWTDLYNKIRSDVGVESFAVGPRAVHGQRPEARTVCSQHHGRAGDGLGQCYRRRGHGHGIG